MLSRRGFFGMLAGLAMAPLTKLVPERRGITNVLIDGYPIYPLHIQVRGKSIPTQAIRIKPGKVFRCGTGEMGTLYWSKESNDPKEA